MQIVMGMNRDPIAGDCHCPICADLALRGEPLYTLLDGALVEVQQAIPEMMEVVLRGTDSTAPFLPLEPEKRQVPVGCTLFDFVACLPYGNRAFEVACPPGTLLARLNGDICDPRQVLQPGDEVEVYAERDAELSALMDLLLARGPSEAA